HCCVVQQHARMAAREAPAVRSRNETDLWEVSSGKKFRQFKEAGHPVAFSADGAILAVASHERISLWDAKTGNERLLFGDQHYRGFRRFLPPVAFAPDGKLLVTVREDNTVSLWEPATGKLVRQWQQDKLR